MTPTLATLLLLAAEDPQVIRVHDSYTVTESSADPAALQPEVADRVAARLGMTPLGRNLQHRCYFHRPGIDPHEYCFSFERTASVYRYSVSTSQHANEFWRRTFINMGFGYLWEGLHYIPIFAGPFLGKTPKDKVGIPLLGLGSLLFWKLTFNGLLVRSHLTEYISVAGSGYKSPRGIRTDD